MGFPPATIYIEAKTRTILVRLFHLLKNFLRPSLVKELVLLAVASLFVMSQYRYIPSPAKRNLKPKAAAIVKKEAAPLKQEIAPLKQKPMVAAPIITPPLIVPLEQPKVVKKQIVKVAKKRKLRPRMVKPEKPVPIDELLAAALECEEVGAINLIAPLTTLADEAWDNDIPAENLGIERSAPVRERLTTKFEILGEVLPADFSSFSQLLEQARNEVPKALKPVQAKMASLTLSQEPPKQVLSDASTPTLDAREDEASKRDNVEPSSQTETQESEFPEEQEPDESDLEPSTAQMPSPPPIAPVPSLGPVEASVSGVFNSLWKNSTTQPVDQAQTTHQMDTQTQNTPVVPEPPAPPYDGKLYGTLLMDKTVENWLEEKKGYVEISLQPVQSKDYQDSIFAPYEYPSDQFEIEVGELKGEYKLVANLFSPKSSVPVAQFVHSEKIDSNNAKRRIRFELTADKFNAGKKADPSRLTPPVVYTATIFEGASGSTRQAKTVSGAQVVVVGIPEIPPQFSDAQGNVRFEGVPTHSELIVSVQASGYHATHVTVPVANSSVYSSLFLVAKETTEGIGYFTRAPQTNETSLVMGRIYDPQSRKTKSEEQVSLSFRRSKPLYLGALPDPRLTATTDTGLFGFFNVAPSFRSIVREEKVPFLFNARPGEGTFVEFGRGGKANLSGVITDPYQNAPVVAIARFVGDNTKDYMADSEGQITFPGIDLPAGALTLEFEAEDYPKTWHTVSWNTRERKKPAPFYLLEKNFVEEMRKLSIGNAVEGHRGTIIGGGDARLFPSKGCLTVELADSNGNSKSGTLTAYPFSRDMDLRSPLCLTKQSPGFAFYNVPDGEYLLKWMRASRTVRTRLVRVGIDRLSIVVN